MSKFEDRANSFMNWSVVFTLFAVFAKGGIPLSSELLERFGMPDIGDGRLLTGLLTAVAMLFAGTAVFYVLQVRHYAAQLQMPALRRTRAGDLAQAIFRIGTIGYAFLIISIICLCLSDVVYAVTYLIDHVRYTMTGWDAQVGPP
jgi:hypothetical protein